MVHTERLQAHRLISHSELKKGTCSRQSSVAGAAAKPSPQSNVSNVFPFVLSRGKKQIMVG